MKAFSIRTFTPWWTALLSLLVLAGCGSDNNPISPIASQVSQVNSINSQTPQNVFSGSLTGAEEIPSVTSNGTGTGIVSVNPANNRMKATIVTADINGTQAHIHLGARGVAGPIVFPLTETEAGSGIWTTTATLTADQLTQLKSGNYYFNVHSAAFPEGEIRGQIRAQLPQSGSAISTSSSTTPYATGASASGASANGTTASAAAADNRPVFYTNVLSGSLVVPPNASTASATAVAAYRPNNRTLHAVIISQGLTVTGANLREAAAGATGPLVARFTESAVGSGIWVVRATLTTTQAEALNNGAMYYELLSSAFPEGELRGQIVKTQGPTATATPATPATPAAPATPATPGTVTTPTQPATPSTGATPAITPTTTTSTAPTTTTTTTPTTPTTPTTTTTTTTPITTTMSTTIPTTPTTGEATSTGTTTPSTGTTGTTSTGTTGTSTTGTGAVGTTGAAGTTSGTGSTGTDTTGTGTTGTGTTGAGTTGTSTTPSALATLASPDTTSAGMSSQPGTPTPTITPVTTITGAGAIGTPS